ncbi:MAG TPA: ATPase [Clostridiales bacterium UBA8153]|nr:ATPase [Clostridiales bacterium UBA8153]
MKEFLVGVDGGGSKTACLAVEWNGRAAGYAVGGPSNYHGIGAAAAGQVLRATIAQALASSGALPGEVGALCAGLAGCDRADDRATVESMLAPLACRRMPLVVNDARVALAGAFGSAPGVVVISGTGSIVMGQHGGRIERAGGWGPLLGDEGSGYDVGRRGAVAALRAYDGRGPGTLLVDLYRQYLEGDLDLLIPLVYRPITPADMGRLARLVGEAAGAKDPVALGILEASAGELALGVHAVARRLGLDRPAVVAVGGLFRELPALRQLVAARLGYSHLEWPRYAPVVGAVALAAGCCGYQPEAGVMDSWQRVVLEAGGWSQ